MRIRGGFLVAAMAFGLGACASVYNLPLNKPSAAPFLPAVPPVGQRGEGSSTIVGLAFSGGGTRAAAFAYGVLGELARTPSPRERGRDLIDHVGLVTGVSGGSIIAAYFGLKGRDALTDFRQRYLDQDLMAELRTSIDLTNISRALGGGVNDDSRLRNWLNANLYHDATFGTLLARRRPVVLINATDIYNRTPFVFEPATFAAMCSDLTGYPIAAAVAASAAVPAAFAPVVLETFPGQCNAPLPEGMLRAARDPFTSPQLHAFARALERSRIGAVKYIKLLDGGLVDNFGLSSLTITREVAGTPYGPLQPNEAVNLRRLLFLVIDAGVGPGGQWSQTLEGPAGGALVSAVVDVVVEANSQSSFAAFEATMRSWREQMVRWRCGLRSEEVARLRGRSGPWNCNDLKITVGRISFGQLDAERAKILNAVPTSFSLPPDAVDALTSAGADALQANPTFQAFLRER
jgi:predicted acylesterase/phospholipase RssA